MRIICVCALILSLACGCNRPAAKTATIEELVGFDVQEYAKRNAWDYETKVDQKKREILADPRVIMITTGQNLESALGIMLQPPLAKVYLDHRNTITSLAQGSVEQRRSDSPDDQAVNGWFKQSAANTFMENGIEIVNDVAPDIPILSLKTNLSSQRENDPAVVYYYEISFEFKRDLQDPLTGLRVLSTVWTTSKATFLDQDLIGLKEFSKTFIDNEMRKLIRFEVQRGLFKAALHQLKEEDKVPELYQPILSNYKDWQRRVPSASDNFF